MFDQKRLNERISFSQTGGELTLMCLLLLFSKTRKRGQENICILVTAGEQGTKSPVRRQVRWSKGLISVSTLRGSVSDYHTIALSRACKSPPCPQDYPSSFYFVSQIKHVILAKLGKTHGYMKCVKL